MEYHYNLLLISIPLFDAAHLPVEETIIEPDEDTTGLTKISEEVTETLEYTPASLVIKRVIRPKYGKKDGHGILIANLPPWAILKCIAESSLLAYIMVSKFVDHLPFYRQIQRFIYVMTVFKIGQLDNLFSFYLWWTSIARQIQKMLYPILIRT